MPRLSFKPDSSFFRKIVVGAVGARAVIGDLQSLGHECRELERGSTETKLWKDVKRKRVRIPDLVCLRCGRRIECRAKTKLELAMSHSPTDAERAWDFGMVDSDWIAFPVCEAINEMQWSSGLLRNDVSFWREKAWLQWRSVGKINYFTVEAFRSRLHARTRTKGTEEASESVIAWDATFSQRHGIVEGVDHATGRVTVRRLSDNHRYTWTVAGTKQIAVATNDEVKLYQVLAAAALPIRAQNLECPGQLPAGHVTNLLHSRERTQRFTGTKLARLLNDRQFEAGIYGFVGDLEEDVYIRLEAVSYLCAICGHSARELFSPFLDSPDEQTQLEAVIALGEAATGDAIQVLCEILNSGEKPYFLRSAAAWSLSRTNSDVANRQLVQSFSDVEHKLREEALDCLTEIGNSAIPVLMEGLRTTAESITAGCAEALRRAGELPTPATDQLVGELVSGNPGIWTIWLIGHLPREQFASAIVPLQQQRPDLHFAISVLWSFAESWISRNWELRPRPEMPQTR